MNRADRIARQIHQITGDFLIKNRPEGCKNALITVTQAKISSDLMNARIYFSIYPGGPEFKRKCMAGLIDMRGRIRYEIGSQLNLRNVPEIKLYLDDSTEHAEKINKLLRDIS